MDDITRFLLSDRARPSLTSSSLQSMGKRASAMYLDGGISLNEAVVKVASECPSITAEQVMRVVENANSSTFLDIFEKQAGDRNVHFEICDPRVVLRTLNIPTEMLKEAADHDYAMDPEGLGMEKSAGLFQNEHSRAMQKIMDEHKARTGETLPGPQVAKIYAAQLKGKQKQASLKDLEADLVLADMFGIRLSTPALNKVANDEAEDKGRPPTEEEKGKIREFLKANKGVSDDEFHAFVEKMGLNPHFAEPVAYEMAHKTASDSTDIVHGGKADNAKASDFPPDQIAKGIKVEKEHTNSRELAKQISMDHLEEFPDYYDRLDKMEEEAKKDLKKQALAFLKIGSKGSDLVLQDLLNATSLENMKKSASGGYPEANPFGELVRMHQRLTKMAEDTGLALLKSEEMRKESEASFVHELKQHMLEGGNLGEVVHALSSVGSPVQVKEAMAFAVPQLVKHGLDMTRARAALVAYEMTKAASVRTVNPDSPIVRSFCGMIKSGADQLQLAESTKALNLYKTKVAKVMAKVSHAASL